MAVDMVRYAVKAVSDRVNMGCVAAVKMVEIETDRVKMGSDVVVNMGREAVNKERDRVKMGRDAGVNNAREAVKVETDRVKMGRAATVKMERDAVKTKRGRVQMGRDVVVKTGRDRVMMGSDAAMKMVKMRWGERLLAVMLVALAASSGVAASDVCEACECVPPGPEPRQAFCRNRGDKAFTSTTTDASRSLELIYVHGAATVALGPAALDTDRPLDLVLDACARVHLADGAVTNARTLVVSDAEEVVLGSLPSAALWAVQLENIGRLEVSLAALPVNYSLSIGRVDNLTLLPPAASVFDDPACVDKLQLSFSLFDSKVTPLPAGGLSLCGGNVTVSGNRFESVAEGGFLVATEGAVAVVGNQFERVARQAFNLTAPQIHLTGNRFASLPAGALRAVDAARDAFFTENDVGDGDLGGVLLDMSFYLVFEENRFECDCASKRTSILDPKEDMLALSEDSMNKLHNIFANNYCRMNCSVSLLNFKTALVAGEVCLTNDTRLEPDTLCSFATEPSGPESDTTSPTDTTNQTDRTDTTTDRSLVSAASRPEILIPLALFLVTLIVSSLCVGCRECSTFRFTFTPGADAVPKPIEMVR